MSEWFDIFPMILAHFSPRKRAEWRLLCKRMCALISAGIVARKFWGKDYLEFLKMINTWKPEHQELFANGTWTIKMMNQVQRMIYIGKNQLENPPYKGFCSEAAFLNSVDSVSNLLRKNNFYIEDRLKLKLKTLHTISNNDIYHLYVGTDDHFMIGLIEGLFTLSDFQTKKIYITTYREFLKSEYGLQLLREKLMVLDDLGHFVDDYYVEYFFNDPISVIGLRDGSLTIKELPHEKLK